MILCRVQGKCIGGGVGIAAAADYTVGTAQAAVKLSELAVRYHLSQISAVERKTGKGGFCNCRYMQQPSNQQLGRGKGLYAEVFETINEADSHLADLANTLATSSPDAMQALKQVSWEGTEHWDTLLAERAAVSGRLVLTDFAKNAIHAFKSKK
ncbi:MAG: enoyl-CoA hydratase-related protein [Saprospiraceae bacterium]